MDRFYDRLSGKINLAAYEMGFQDLLNNSPLEGRGWTLQERFLAGRILHFGHQMFWECWETVQSEDFRYKTTLTGIPLNPLYNIPKGLGGHSRSRF